MKRYKSICIILICIIIITSCGKNTSGEVIITEELNDVYNETDIEHNSGLDDVHNETDIELNSGLDDETGQNQSQRQNSIATTETNISEDIVPNTLRLVMAGDILLHTRVSDSARLEDGTYDYNPIFAHTSELISSADLALVNEEVIIGGEELGVSGYPSFNAPYEVGDALVQNGFDVILHATNHAMDKGKKGLVNCMNFWEDNYPDISVLGIHDSAEDQQDIFYYEHNGIKIAILNYTYGTNGISLPGDMPWSVDLLEKDKVVADLTEAEQNADFTVVCPHWGTEYNLGVSEQQKKWAKIFVQNGADLIIGTHPHVIEPVEWYEDEESGNSALIYYSIGNFVNWTSGSGSGAADRMVGGLADVTLKLDNDRVIIDEYTVHGLVCHLAEGMGNVTTYQIKDYTEELAYDNMMVRQDSHFSYEYCINLCNEVWSNWE